MMMYLGRSSSILECKSDVKGLEEKRTAVEVAPYWNVNTSLVSLS